MIRALSPERLPAKGVGHMSRLQAFGKAGQGWLPLSGIRSNVIALRKHPPFTRYFQSSVNAGQELGAVFQTVSVHLVKPALGLCIWSARDDGMTQSGMDDGPLNGPTDSTPRSSLPPRLPLGPTLQRSVFLHQSHAVHTMRSPASSAAPRAKDPSAGGF